MIEPTLMDGPVSLNTRDRLRTDIRRERVDIPVPHAEIDVILKRAGRFQRAAGRSAASRDDH